MVGADSALCRKPLKCVSSLRQETGTALHTRPGHPPACWPPASHPPCSRSVRCWRTRHTLTLCRPQRARSREQGLGIHRRSVQHASGCTGACNQAPADQAGWLLSARQARIRQPFQSSKSQHSTDKPRKPAVERIDHWFRLREKGKGKGKMESETPWGWEPSSLPNFMP